MGFLSNGGYLAVASITICACQWMILVTIKDLGRLLRDLRDISRGASHAKQH
ncbi:hypothetical protein HNR55_002513 [Acetobacter lovaniensis]|uniref:Uncharacterized protein n=1 Tax=Acetobacter lovaniensis TaxID=104100 RepID=A0A841QFX1_9PROT|nr:hypothetical protein [Acetobacter lovaniensis]